jgi:hypothetical protein
MRSQSIWESVHLLKDLIESFFYLLVDIGCESGFIDDVDCLPNFVNFTPDALEELMVFDKVLKTKRISKLHIQELFGFANPDPFSIGGRNLLANYIELIQSFLGSILCCSWSGLLPLILNFFEFVVAGFFFIENFGLESRNLILHQSNFLG